MKLDQLQMGRRRFVIGLGLAATLPGLGLSASAAGRTVNSRGWRRSRPLLRFRVSVAKCAEAGCGAPVFAEVQLDRRQVEAAGEGRLGMARVSQPGGWAEAVGPAQFEAAAGQNRTGRLWWIPDRDGVYELVERAEGVSVVEARLEAGTGQIEVGQGHDRLLRYNYQRVEPGEVLQTMAPDNLKYARPRSDYVHPVYGFDGEELTKDWSKDHPHHRGIYWAWPEVDWRGERGDLHALQRVFARPTGACERRNGPVFATIDATNTWLWDDREPVVRERTLIRAFGTTSSGRWVDFDFRFEALDGDVAVARRGTNAYGGLNLRCAAVRDQQIRFHTDPPEAGPRMAWGELSGTFSTGREGCGLVVFQHQANPDYPGDWVQYPDLNWFQPTFPGAGRRQVISKDRPLALRFRLWLHRGPPAGEDACRRQWDAWHGLGEWVRVERV